MCVHSVRQGGAAAEPHALAQSEMLITLALLFGTGLIPESLRTLFQNPRSSAECQLKSFLQLVEFKMKVNIQKCLKD